LGSNAYSVSLQNTFCFKYENYTVFILKALRIALNARDRYIILNEVGEGEIIKAIDEVYER